MLHTVTPVNPWFEAKSLDAFAVPRVEQSVSETEDSEQLLSDNRVQPYGPYLYWHRTMNTDALCELGMLGKAYALADDEAV